MPTFGRLQLSPIQLLRTKLTNRNISSMIVFFLYYFPSVC